MCYINANALTLRLTGQYRNLDGNARIFRANILQKGGNSLASGFSQDTVFHDGRNEQQGAGEHEFLAIAHERRHRAVQRDAERHRPLERLDARPLRARHHKPKPKKPSKRRLTANRRNATKSTGPGMSAGVR